MKNQIFTILVLLTVLTSGCISGYFTDEPENEFIGCTDGGEVDHNGTEESFSIEEVQDVVNETNTTNTTNNSTTAPDNNNTEMDPGEGVEENQTILNFNALIHNYGESNWSDFQLHSMFDYGWNNTTNSTSKWTVIFFLSTDCGHCWNGAELMSQLHENYSDQVTFVSFIINFSWSNSSLEEIAAFQDEANLTGCNNDRNNCNERPGSPHNWTYFDDRDLYWLAQFHMTGTPSYVLVQPDGVVGWHTKQRNESIQDAMANLFTAAGA